MDVEVDAANRPEVAVEDIEILGLDGMRSLSDGTGFGQQPLVDSTAQMNP